MIEETNPRIEGGEPIPEAAPPAPEAAAEPQTDRADDVYRAVMAARGAEGVETVDDVAEEEEQPAKVIPDDLPLTVDEVKGAVTGVLNRIKTAGMKPVRRAGRTYMRSAERAVDWFADGLGTDDKDKS